MITAIEQLSKDQDRARDERELHDRMEWFFKRYAPADKREAAEFHADLAMVVQAVHRDAGRETHRLLRNALAVMPPVIFTKADDAAGVTAPTVRLPSTSP